MTHMGLRVCSLALVAPAYFSHEIDEEQALLARYPALHLRPRPHYQ